MSWGDIRLALVVFVFSITFCGDPDLHDKIIERLNGCDEEVLEG